MTREALDRLYGLDRDRPPRGALARGLALIIRHHILVLVVMLAITALAGYLSTRLSLVTDFAQLIPQDTRSVSEQHKAEQYLGNTSLLTIVVHGTGDSAGERARQAAAALAERLASDPEFDFVFFRLDLGFFERNAPLYMSVADLEDLYQRLDRRIRAEILAKNPLFIDLDDEDLDDKDLDDKDLDDNDSGDAAGTTASDRAASGATEPAGEPDIFDPETLRKLYFKDRAEIEAREYLTSDDGKTYLVLTRPLHPPADIGYDRRILAHVRDQIADLHLADRFGPGIDFALTGNYWSTTEENDSARHDLNQASYISGILLLLVVVAYFRRLRAIWIIFVPLLCGVIAMMGYAELAVGKLNTITGFCFALFMGLAIGYGIHFLARYDEERGRGSSLFQALLITYRESGGAVVAAAATTSVGFLALVAAEFEGFREFGIIAGGGIMICLVVVAVMLPAIIALTARVARERRFAPFRFDKSSQRRRPRLTRISAILALLLTGFFAWRASQLEWEDDFRNLRGGKAETLAIAEKATAIVGRSTQPTVRIASSVAEVRRLTDACNRERLARGKATAVHMCVSLADLLPDNQEAKLPIIARIKGLLTDDRLAALDPDTRAAVQRLRDEAPVKPITEPDLPEGIRLGLVSHHGHKYLMTAYPKDSTWLASNNIRFAEELLAGDDVSESDIGPIGASMVMADLMRVMKHDSVIVVVIALIAVFAVVLALFRSLTKALAAYLPLVAGLVWTLGIMELLGWRMSLFNMIVLPSLLGLAVDNNIHLFHRYHIEGRGSWPYVIATTGMACLIAALTTAVGFAGLVAAGHRGLQTIGNLAIVGMLVATCVSLVVLPALVSLVEGHVRGTGFGIFPAQSFTGGDRRRQD